jgi:hypothetical protein
MERRKKETQKGEMMVYGHMTRYAIWRINRCSDNKFVSFMITDCDFSEKNLIDFCKEHCLTPYKVMFFNSVKEYNSFRIFMRDYMRGKLLKDYIRRLDINSSL